MQLFPGHFFLLQRHLVHRKFQLTYNASLPRKWALGSAVLICFVQLVVLAINTTCTLTGSRDCFDLILNGFLGNNSKFASICFIVGLLFLMVSFRPAQIRYWSRHYLPLPKICGQAAGSRLVLSTTWNWFFWWEVQQKEAELQNHRLMHRLGISYHPSLYV